MFKPYQKKDGSLMLYLNCENGVSVGISDRVFTSKLTAGQSKLLDRAKRAAMAGGMPFTGDLASHKEALAQLDLGYALALTDVANVGGMVLHSDGGYVIKGGRILECGVWYDEPAEA